MADIYRNFGNAIEINKRQREEYGVPLSSLGRVEINPAEYQRLQEESFRLLPTFSDEERGPINANMAPFIDLSNEENKQGRLVYDRYPIESAHGDAMASGFARGTWDWNIENLKWVADMVVGFGPQDWKTDSEFYKMSPDMQILLNHYHNSDATNITKHFESRPAGTFSPLSFEIGKEGQTQQLFDEEQKGFTVEKGLQELSEKAPDVFIQYSRAFNGFEYDIETDSFVPEASMDTLMALGAGAKNGHELLYKLNAAMQLQALGRSIEDWERNTPVWNRYKKYVESFVMQGILNDPDLIASMAITGGLTLLSGGAAGLATIPLWALKFDKVRRRFGQFKTLRKAALGFSRGTGKFSDKIRSGANWLIPENIPHSIITSGRLGRWYAKQSGGTKVLTNIGANMVEGGLSGSLAETFNQRALVNYRIQDEFSWKAVAMEGALEALLSPALNPIMGGAFKLAVASPTFAIGSGMKIVGQRQMAERFGDGLKSMARNLNGQTIVAQAQLENALIENDVTLSEILAEGDSFDFKNSPDFLTVLSTLRENIEISDADFVTLLGDQLTSISRGLKAENSNGQPAQKITPDELMLELTSGLFTTLKDRDTNLVEGQSLRDVQDKVEIRLSMLESWKKRGKEDEDMELFDWVDRELAEGRAWPHIPERVKSVVEQEVGEENFSKMSDEDKMNKLYEIEGERLVDQQRAVSEVEGMLQQILETFDEDYAGSEDLRNLETPPTPPTPPTTDTSEQSVDTDSELGDGDGDGEGEGSVEEAVAEVSEENADQDSQDVEGEKAAARPFRPKGGRVDPSKVRRNMIKALDIRNEKLQDENLTTEERAEIKEEIASIERMMWKLEKLIESLEAIMSNVHLDSKGRELAKADRDAAVNAINAVEAHRIKHKDVYILFNKHFDYRTKGTTTEKLGILRSKLFSAKKDPASGKPVVEKKASYDSLTSEDKALLRELAELIGDSKLSDMLLSFASGVTKEITFSKFQSAIKKFGEIGTKLENTLNSGDEAKAKREAVEAHEKAHNEFLSYRHMSRINANRAARKRGEFVFTTARTWQSVMREQKLRIERLETFKEDFETEIEQMEGDTVSLETMVYMLPNSETRAVLFDQHTEENKAEESFADPAQEMTEVPERTTYTKEEAKEIFEAAYKESKKSIRDFKLDQQLLIDARAAAMSPETRLMHDVPEDTYIPADYSSDQIIDMSNPSVTLSADLMDPEKNSSAWTEYGSQILVLAASTQIRTESDGTRTVSGMRLQGVMPDLFVAQKRAPFMLFREAVTNMREDASALELAADASILRYDIDMVVDIAKREQRRASSFVKKDMKRKEKYARSVFDRNDISETSKDITEAITELHSIDEGFRATNTNLFKLHGFIRDIDPTTGHPTRFVEDSPIARDAYVAAYRKAVTVRLSDRWNRMSTQLKTKVLEDLKYYEFRDVDEAYAAAAERMKDNQAGWLGFIANHEKSFVLNSLTNETWRIHSDFDPVNFGNGTVDWLSPDHAANALVDYVTRKSINSSPGRAMTSESEESLGEEGTEYGGETLETTVALYGDLHGAAPMGPTHIARTYQDFLHRRRIKAVIEADFSKLTDADRAEMWDTIRERAKEGGTNIGIARTPNLIPSPTYGTMGGKPMKREEMKEFLIEFLYDMPAFAHSFVQDSLIVADGGAPLRLREDLETYFEGISVGDDLIVPASRMPEIIAIELRSPENFKALSESALNSLFELEDKFAEESGFTKNEEGWRSHMFSDRNEADRNDSVAREIRIAGMLNDPQAQIEITKLRDEVFDKIFTRHPDDAHVWGAKLMLEQLRNKQLMTAQLGSQNLVNIQKFEKLLSIFDGIDSQNPAEGKDKLSKEELRLYNAVRDLVKVPLLREKYEAGKNAFNNEWRLSNGKARSAFIKALREYKKVTGETLMEIDSAEYKEMVNALEKFMFDVKIEGAKRIISVAARMDPAMKAKAAKALQIPIDQEVQLDYWQQLIRETQGKDPKERASAFKSRLQTTEFLRGDLIARLQKVAALKNQTYDQVFNQFKDRITEALDFLENHKGPLVPGSDAWGQYVEILTGNIAAWRDIPFFEAVNTLNSSAHMLDPERWAFVSEALGFTDFDKNDALGLDSAELQTLMYMTSLPSEKSHRGYVLHNFLFGNTQGDKLGKAAVNPGEFMEFVNRRLGEIKGREANRSERIAILSEYLSLGKDNIEAIGVWNLIDDPYGHMSEEEFSRHMDDLILKQAMLQYADVQAPPIKGYRESETATDAALLRQEFSETWYSSSESRHTTLLEEIEIERDLLARATSENPDNGAIAILDQRASQGRIFSPEVAAYHEQAMTRYYQREYLTADVRTAEVTTRTDGKPITFTTMSHSPKAKTGRAPYASRGSLRLQIETLKRMQTDMQSRVRRLAGIDDTPTEESTESMGWQSPWKQETLPKPVPILSPEFSLDGVSVEAALRAGELYSEIRSFASANGRLSDLDNNPELYAHFYITMEMQKHRNKIIRMINRKKSKGEPVNAIEIRNMWLTRLNDVTQLSRDIANARGLSLQLEEQTDPLYLLKEIDEAMTWRGILTSDDLLSRSVLNKEALEMGTVPSEGIRIVNGDLNRNEGFESQKDIARQFASTLVQMNDFTGLLLSALVKRYSVKAIRKVMAGHPDIDKLSRQNNILDTSVFTNKEKQAIRAEILEMALAAGNNDLIFDISLVEGAMESPELVMKSLQDQDPHIMYELYEKRGRGKETNFRFNIRHPYQGFATAIVGAPRMRKGANISIAISMESALQIFALNANRSLQERITWANIVGAPYGSKTDSQTGKRIPNKDLAQKIDNVVGFRVEEQTRADINTSEALDLLAGGTSKKRNIQYRVKNKRRKLENSATEVVDLHRYASENPASYLVLPENRNLSRPHIEAHVQGLERVFASLESKGLVTGKEDLDIIERIRGYINDARMPMIDDSIRRRVELKAIVYSLVFQGRMMNEPVDTELVSIFTYLDGFDNKKQILGDIQTMIQNATEDLNMLSAFTDSKVNNPEFGLVKIDTPVYWFARDYFSMAADRDNPSFDDFLEYADMKENYNKGSEETKADMVNSFNAALSEEVDQELFAADQEMIKLSPGEMILSREDMRVHTKSSESFIDILDTKITNPFKTDLLNLNTDIQTMVNEGVAKDGEAKMLRQMILKLYNMNPMLLQGVRFKLVDIPGMAARIGQESDGNYVVRVGKNLRTVYGENQTMEKLTFVEIITHELAHIAQQKFINENGIMWTQWKQLKNEGGGLELIEKLCLALHGGVRTEKAAIEIDSYMKDDREFIAGMVSYYLLADHLPNIERLSPDAEKFKGETFKIVDRIINFVRDILWNMRSVFFDFERANPESTEQLNKLVKRTLGRDENSMGMLFDTVGNDSLGQDIPKWVPAGANRRAVAAATGGTVGALAGGPAGAVIGATAAGAVVGPRSTQVFDDAPWGTQVAPDKQMSDVDYEAAVENYIMLEEEVVLAEASSDSQAAFDARKELKKAAMFFEGSNPDTGQIEITGGMYGDKKTILGLNRFSYTKSIIELKKMGVISPNVKGDLQLDIDKIITINEDGNPALIDSEGFGNVRSTEHAVAAFEFLIKQAHERQGTPLSEGVGSWALALSKNLMTMYNKGRNAIGLPNTPTNRIRGFVIQLLTGTSGSGNTYGSPYFILPILTSILSEQAVTTTGHSVNIGGTTSIMEALDRTNLFMNPIHEAERRLGQSISVTTRAASRIPTVNARNEIFQALTKQVWLLVENPKHKIEIESNSVNKDQAEEAIKDLASNISIYIKLLEEQGIELETEILGVEGFGSPTPHRMQRLTPEEGELSTALDPLFRNHILQEIDAEDGRICPAHLTCAKGMLPTLTSMRDFILDFNNMDPEFKEWYIREISKNLRQGSRDMAIHYIREIESKTDIPSDEKSPAWGYIQQAHNEIINKMFKGSIRWSTFSSNFNLTRRMKESYRAIVEDQTTNFAQRLKFMTSTLRPRAIHKSASPGSRAVVHPIHILRSSYVKYSQSAIYMPSQNWTVPKLSAVLDSDAAPFFMTGPLDIMQEFHKGIGSDIVEAQLLSAIFGIKGSFTDVINLGQFAVGATASDSIFNLDGTATAKNSKEHLKKGLNQIDEKHRYIKHITEKDEEPFSAMNWVLSVMPDAAKIGYGTNLSAATLLVEGGLNIQDSFVNFTSVRATMNSIMAPVRGSKWVSKMGRGRQFKELSTDMMHITESMVNTYYADFEESIAMDKGMVKKFAKSWGTANTYLAHKILTGLVHTRAANARLTISKLIAGGKLDTLVKYLNDTHPDIVSGKMEKNTTGTGTSRKLLDENSTKFFDLCRKAGIGKFGFGNREVLRYLLRSGLLLENRYNDLKNMLGHGKEHLNLNEDKQQIFWISHMKKTMEAKYASNEEGFSLEEAEQSLAQSQGYRDRLFILQSLRQVERIYIEDVVLTPNAMDMYTKPSAWGMAFEVYMRYPTVFAASRVIRLSGRMSPAKWALNLLTASVLDMLYMTMLSTASQGWEDTKRRWADERREVLLGQLRRLPAFGRWLQFIVDVGMSVTNVEGAAKRRDMAPVGLTAGMQVARSFWENAIEPFYSDEDPARQRRMLPEFTEENAFALIKFLPIGDIFLRAFWKSRIEGSSEPSRRFHIDYRRQYREQPPEEADPNDLGRSDFMYENMTPEDLFDGILKELGVDLAQELDPQMLASNRLTAPAQPTPQPTPTAAAPPEPPQADSGEGTDVVTMIEESSEGTSGDLADRLA